MATKKKTTFGISFPDEQILERAKIHAKSLGMTLSAYVNQLIRRDLNLPGAFTAYREADTPQPARSLGQASEAEEIALAAKIDTEVERRRQHERREAEKKTKDRRH